MTAEIRQIPQLTVRALSLTVWRMGHTWEAAQLSIDATSVTAGHDTKTNLSRGGL